MLNCKSPENSDAMAAFDLEAEVGDNAATLQQTVHPHPQEA